LRDDGRAAKKGWFVGSFIEPTDGPHNTKDVEIKFWEFEKGPPDPPHPFKRSSSFEFTLILSGRVRACVSGETFELSAGDYVVIPPQTPNNTVVEILDTAEGLTVKAPSPDRKEELKWSCCSSEAPTD
jgi:quercetin dioxygenase-like cupin family protein